MISLSSFGTNYYRKPKSLSTYFANPMPPPLYPHMRISTAPRLHQWDAMPKFMRRPTHAGHGPSTPLMGGTSALPPNTTARTAAISSPPTVIASVTLSTSTTNTSPTPPSPPRINSWLSLPTAPRLYLRMHLPKALATYASSRSSSNKLPPSLTRQAHSHHNTICRTHLQGWRNEWSTHLQGCSIPTCMSHAP